MGNRAGGMGPFIQNLIYIELELIFSVHHISKESLLHAPCPLPHASKSHP